MKYAIIADIHGNYLALEAVLEDIKQQKADRIINLGDHFSGAMDAKRTGDILLETDAISIAGNHDRWLIEKDPTDMGTSDKIAYSQLKTEHLKWLQNLPAERTEGDEIYMCHGTPASDTTYLLEHVNPDGSVTLSSLEYIEQQLQDISHPVILCGHTHIPRVINLPDGRLILNPGSVGCQAYMDTKPLHHIMQTGSPQASYMILEKQNGKWIASVRHIPYDYKQMAKLAISNDQPAWAHMLETGWISVK